MGSGQDSVSKMVSHTMLTHRAEHDEPFLQRLCEKPSDSISHFKYTI